MVKCPFSRWPPRKKYPKVKIEISVSQILIITGKQNLPLNICHQRVQNPRWSPILAKIVRDTNQLICHSSKCFEFANPNCFDTYIMTLTVIISGHMASQSPLTKYRPRKVMATVTTEVMIILHCALVILLLNHVITTISIYTYFFSGTSPSSCSWSKR